MSAGVPSADDPFHVDLRPGWRQMLLTPVEEETWDKGFMDSLEWVVGGVLGSLRHRFHRWDQSIVVSNGPPDAGPGPRSPR